MMMMEYTPNLPRRFCPVILQHNSQNDISFASSKLPSSLQIHPYFNTSRNGNIFNEHIFRVPLQTEVFNSYPVISKRHECSNYSEMDVPFYRPSMHQTWEKFRSNRDQSSQNYPNLGARSNFNDITSHEYVHNNNEDINCFYPRRHLTSSTTTFVKPMCQGIYSRNAYDNEKTNKSQQINIHSKHSDDNQHQIKSISKLPLAIDMLRRSGRFLEKMNLYVNQIDKPTLEKNSDVERSGKQLQGRINKCPYCNKFKSSPAQLKIHLRIHTGERPFVCRRNDCNKTFARNEELTRHLRIHTGYRPYICRHCQRRFGRKDHLRKHEITHQSARDKKVYVCLVDGCTQSYTRSDALARHRWNIHLISPQINNVRVGTINTQGEKIS